MFEVNGGGEGFGWTRTLVKGNEFQDNAETEGRCVRNPISSACGCWYVVCMMSTSCRPLPLCCAARSATRPVLHPAVRQALRTFTAARSSRLSFFLDMSHLQQNSSKLHCCTCLLQIPSICSICRHNHACTKSESSSRDCSLAYAEARLWEGHSTHRSTDLA